MTPAPAVAGARAEDAPMLDEQLLGRRLRQHRHPERLGLLGEEARELRHGQDHVAVVPHRRRRRDPVRGASRQHVHGLARHLAVRGDVGHREPSAEELAQRARIDDGPREQVRTGLLSLLEHGDRHLAELLLQLRMLLEQLSEPYRAREPAGTSSDDEDPDLDSLLGRIRRNGDRVDRGERWRELARPGHGRCSSTRRGGRGRARSAWARSGAGRPRPRSRRSRRSARSRPC